MGRPRLRTDDLRERVLDEAVRLVADHGPSALTTRAVASSASTSLAAVNELFGGKRGLIRAIFVEGFDRLAASVGSLPVAPDPEAGILDLAQAFRTFAVEHGQLYDVMFSRPYADFQPEPDDLTGYRTTGRAVRSRVDALFDQPTHRTVREDAAMGLTAALHGLVRMELAGILGSSPRSIERRWRTTVLATARGLRS